LLNNYIIHLEQDTQPDVSCSNYTCIWLANGWRFQMAFHYLFTI